MVAHGAAEPKLYNGEITPPSAVNAPILFGFYQLRNSSFSNITRLSKLANSSPKEYLCFSIQVSL
jgi:hypothetical protein